MDQLASKSLMREAGLEPAYPKMPDPKSASGAGPSPSCAMWHGKRPRTTPHPKAPNSTGCITDPHTRLAASFYSWQASSGWCVGLLLLIGAAQ